MIQAINVDIVIPSRSDKFNELSSLGITFHFISEVDYNI